MRREGWEFLCRFWRELLDELLSEVGQYVAAVLIDERLPECGGEDCCLARVRTVGVVDHGERLDAVLCREAGGQHHVAGVAGVDEVRTDPEGLPATVELSTADVDH